MVLIKMTSILAMLGTLVYVDSFGLPYSPQTSLVVLRMGGLFDFNPFGGMGSGQNSDFLDEQWEAQQEILRKRQNNGLTKDELQAKYKKQLKNKADDGPSIDETVSLASSSETVATAATQQQQQPQQQLDASNPLSFAFFAVPAESQKSVGNRSVLNEKRLTTDEKNAQEKSSSQAQPSFGLPKFNFPWEK